VNDRSPDIYAGIEPKDLAVYRVSEAARYLSMPASTLRAWMFGQRSSGGTFERVLEPADPARRLLSFLNLVEAHVLSILRVEHGIPLPRIRNAIDYLKESTGKARPLVDLDLQTDGAHLFLRASEDILNVSRGGQYSLVEVIEAFLHRVERGDGGVIRLYPFTRKSRIFDPEQLRAQPRAVVIDPAISFGRPVIARTNIRTSVVAERYLAGESIEELASDYARPRLEIEEAIRCESRTAA
jgi:uncharacterized protein (DUF433 family)